MSSIFRTNRLKYSNTFAGHGEHRGGKIVFFSSENPYFASLHSEHQTTQPSLCMMIKFPSIKAGLREIRCAAPQSNDGDKQVSCRGSL